MTLNNNCFGSIANRVTEIAWGSAWVIAFALHLFIHLVGSAFCIQRKARGSEKQKQSRGDQDEKSCLKFINESPVQKRNGPVEESQKEQEKESEYANTTVFRLDTATDPLCSPLSTTHNNFVKNGTECQSFTADSTHAPNKTTSKRKKKKRNRRNRKQQLGMKKMAASTNSPAAYGSPAQSLAL